MSQGGKSSADVANGKFTLLANWIVRICGGVIFLFLTWYSMRYTQYMNPGGDEVPVNVRDSMSRNLLFLFLVLAVFVWLMHLEKRIAPGIREIIMRSALLLSMLWVGAWSFWWIMTVERMPQGDQAFMYGGASYFLEGSYSFLEKGGYCDLYPHQLALMALMELLFLGVGTYNFFAFQMICAALSVAIVYIGYEIVREITEKMSAAVFYCLTVLGGFPLIFYSGWVYGDIPSIFFSFLAAWLLLRYSKRRHGGCLAGAVASLTMAVLVRKNSLILVIAFCLVAIVRAVSHKDKKIILAAVLSLILPAILYAGVYKMYELRSGHEHSQGLPAASWIAMGMQEKDGKCGWYNDYYKQIYFQQLYDRKITKMIVNQEIKDRMKFFWENPAYAKDFFREKILSQWNEPLYQSLYFSTKYTEECRPADGSFTAKISNEYFTKILWVCDRLQFILYFGMLLYFVFAVKPDSNV